MSFNRHEILKKHYAEEIRGWSWDSIMDEIQRNSRDEDCCEVDGDQKCAYLYIGGVMSMTPSGKIYAPWTTNQTNADMIRDEAWFEALSEVAEEHECFVGSPDGGDGDDIFLCKMFDVEEEAE